MMDYDGKMTPLTGDQARRLQAEPEHERSLRPIFEKGEYIEVKGRWFRVKNFKNGMLTLKGMPVDFSPPEPDKTDRLFEQLDKMESK